MNKHTFFKMLQVENFYERLKEPHDPNENNPHYKEHGIKLPFRMLLIGASGAMKTNSALDICKKFSDTFAHITIVTRNIKEPLYMHMQSSIDKSQLTIIEVEDEDLSDLPRMKELTNKEPHTLIIFDDLVLLKDQKKITEFFIRCRKYNISAMYITQSYFGTPKKIRGNCNMILFKKINSKRDLQMILTEYSLSIELKELVLLHQKCTENQLDWLMIRMDNQSGKQFYHNYQVIDNIKGDDNKNEKNEFKKEDTYRQEDKNIKKEMNQTTEMIKRPNEEIKRPKEEEDEIKGIHEFLKTKRLDDENKKVYKKARLMLK